MSRTIPPNPSLSQLKRQAKELQKAHVGGDASCCATLRLLRRFKGRSDDYILSSPVHLQEIQHSLALDYGFKSWAALRRGVSRKRDLNAQQQDGSGVPSMGAETRQATMVIPGTSDLKVLGNGHQEDSFSHMIVTAAALLGKSADYDLVFAASANGFAPGIETDRWCPGEWSFRGKERCIDLAVACAGLSADMLELPRQPRFSGSQEAAAEFMGSHRGKCAPVIREAMDRGAVVLTSGGWSYRGAEYSKNPDYEWGDAFYQWGIITDANDDGRIVGACMNGRNDNPLGYMEDCWAIWPTDPAVETPDLEDQIFRRAVERIRGEAPFYQAYRRYGYNYIVGEQVFGLQAMDVWMERLGEVPFCRLGCGDDNIYCPSRAVVPVLAGARFSAGYLRSQDRLASRLQLDAAAERYETIVEHLEPLAPLGGYEGIIGDLEKQKEHIGKVMRPIKAELAEAANAIEAATSS